MALYLKMLYPVKTIIEEHCYIICADANRCIWISCLIELSIYAIPLALIHSVFFFLSGGKI